MKLQINNEPEMKQFGAKLGKLLVGGEVLELIGDVGAGKTTLTKGVAEGLEITEPVQSPTFTISRVYNGRDGLVLQHYDFYRLNEAGIMADELNEAMASEKSITIIEWAGAVKNVLPSDRLQIEFETTDENSRQLNIAALGGKSQELLEKLS